MRRIDPTEICFPEGWQEKAQKAFAAVKDKPAAERKEAIDRYSAVWKELKDALMACSNEKCWYCECKRNRDYYAVDHFRPKNKVDECKDHEGYWWLAFDWRNYRFTCSYCNSGITDHVTGVFVGKGTHFPLLEEQRRLRTPPTRYEEHDEELPLLLDPTKPADVGLLTFLKDGRADARYKRDDPIPRNRRSYERAVASIKFYNLDESRTKESRQDLYNEIEKQVNRVQRLIERQTEDVALLDDTLNDVLGKLMQMVGKKAEYSAAAQAYIQLLRPLPQHDWLDEVIIAC